MKIRVHEINKSAQTFSSYLALDKSWEPSAQNNLFSKVSLILTYLLYIGACWFAQMNNFLPVNKIKYHLDDCQLIIYNPDIWINFLINLRYIL